MADRNNRVINDTSIPIATTATIVSQAVFNGQRKVIVLNNNSLAGEIISIGIRNEAIANQGIVLNQGDKMVLSMDSGYDPSNEQITAVASVATATLAIHEEIDLN